MCGILGTINKPFDRATLDLIAHRGPDDFGLESMGVEETFVQFGQRRLSIIDLSPAGHQPMETDCEQYVIIFNGEIYNHQELRAKLPNGIEFRGHSDTETILYYLREFGMAGVKDFNGIFAFAFLDKRRQELYLARDPFGVKPLYYHLGENRELVFASELGPIRKLLGKSDLDRGALASLLRLRYNPAPYTLYSDIKKVRPGHFLGFELSTGASRTVHYSREWTKPASGSVPTKSELTEEYGNHLEQAVKRQLLADVEIGVLLSGGIDSAVVAALAQKHYDTPIKAFTIGFSGGHWEDEIEAAAETAALLGLEHHSKKIGFQDFLDIMRTCTDIVEEPLATTSMIPMYFLAELAAKYVKVVLTGQGADEPLGGYTRYKSELLQEKIPGFIQRIVGAMAAGRNIRHEKIQRGIGTLGIQDDVERFLAVYQVFKPEEIQALIHTADQRSNSSLRYFYDSLNCAEKEHSVERMMAMDTRLNLSDDLLNYTDKITMRFSIECRVPMLDIDLVRYIESLPLPAKVSLRSGKLIHKQFAKQILPDRIVNRPKKAFQSPTKHWFRSGADQIREMLLKKDTPFSTIFDQSAVGRIIDQHQAGFNREKQLFLLLSIYFWLESATRDAN